MRHSQFNFPSRNKPDVKKVRFAWHETRYFEDGTVSGDSGIVENTYASAGYSEQTKARSIIRKRIEELMKDKTNGQIDPEVLFFQLDLTGGAVSSVSKRLGDDVYTLIREKKPRTIKQGADGDELYTLLVRRGNDFVATVLGDWSVQRVKEEEL